MILDVQIYGSDQNLKCTGPPTLKKICGECILCMIHLEQNWLKQRFLWLGELSEAGHGGPKLVVIPFQLVLSC